MSTSVINPIFVDTLARDMQLEDRQTQNLHEFVLLGSTGAGLSQADLATRLYLLAAQFSDTAERRRIAASETPTDWKALWRDLKIRLDSSFTFTKDQEKNIRGLVRDFIIEALRTAYGTIHIDVLAAIKKCPETYGLDNIPGVPAREQALASKVRDAGSSVRNAFRKEVRLSMISQSGLTTPADYTWVSLSQFTFDCLSKHKVGGAPSPIPQTYSAHFAILVRFHKDGENDGRPQKRTRPASRPRGAKAKSGGRIPKGEDFWGQVDIFFKGELKTRGTNLTGLKWKPYIDQIVADDNAHFRGVIPGHPVNESGTQLSAAAGGNMQRHAGASTTGRSSLHSLLGPS
ncbi:hypothetical protein C8R47DRAFT_977840 [Mycena vitilis]|nr:hypothetical protein C8R47DRAFT_977840 [Mycena vitilis]